MERVERFEASLTDEGRYRLLVDAIIDYAVYMLDRNGVITSWNAGARRVKGYTAEEILGHHFSRFYTAEDRAAGLPVRALQQAATEGRFENEGWRVRKDGTRFWAFSVIDPIRDPAGNLIGFAKVTRDLTERKLAEEALRQSEEQFKLLVQGVTDYAIFMLDPEGKVANWNQGAERIKGYSPKEIVGQHFSRFYTAEDRAAGQPARSLGTAAREGRFEAEGWRVRKDGTRFWAHVVIDAIRDAHGKVLGFAKVTRDVSERREAEQELERARESLLQAQKMETIGQLTGGIAHDFNNLLMVVLGSLELLRKRMPAEPRLTALVDNAIRGAQRGATLTQRMLAFARRQELIVGPVDLQALVTDMSDLMRRSLGPAIMIEMQFPAALPPAQTDHNQLETALLNLVLNARDAMSKGGTIRIAGREEEAAPDRPGELLPGRYVCLSVTDTGEGMDARTLARAMEPFFTTKGPGKGTGLGLSMVHGVIRQSGGKLVLRSEPGKGTTAELWLPVAPARSEPVAEPAAARPRTVAAGQTVILVVDDDELVLANTAAMLEDQGHVVLRAGSGRRALELLRERAEIGLVLTDQAMPAMTGLELAQAIRVERPGLRVLLVSGYAELPPGAGTDLPKLLKPFTQEKLLEAVAEALHLPLPVAG